MATAHRIIDERPHAWHMSNRQQHAEHASQWHEQTWFEVLDHFCSDIQQFDRKYRFTLIHAARQWLSKQTSIEDNTAEVLIRFSGLMCDWHLQLYTLNRFGRQLSSARAAEYSAYALWKTGNRQHAFDLLHQHMFSRPSHQGLYQLYRYLLDQSQWQAFYGYHRPDISESLCLESLSYHHMDEYFLQNWDPDVANLCCLPQLNDKQDWLSWFEYEHALNDQTLYAVIHKEWGFVGAVCLVQHNGIGFFYYWLGKDFHGKGLGHQAAALLMALASDCFDITNHYVKVYEHNLASQRLIKKLGFSRIPVNGAPPHENEQFYYFGEVKSVRQQCLELRLLLSNMGADTGVNLPISWLITPADIVCQK